jgi:hypothetical protein
MKAVKYDKVDKLPRKALKVSAYAEQIGQKTRLISVLCLIVGKKVKALTPAIK